MTALPRAIHEEAANGSRFPPFRVLPESGHQVGGVTSIEFDGGIGRPAMLAQPSFEVCNQKRLGRLQCGSSGLANADFDEVLTKEPGAENGVVVAPPSHSTWTSTRAQVLAENVRINVTRHCPPAAP